MARFENVDEYDPAAGDEDLDSSLASSTLQASGDSARDAVKLVQEGEARDGRDR